MTPNLYMDNSNVWIEGQRLSASRNNANKSLSSNLDKSYRLDFGKIIEILCGYKVKPGKLMFYGSEPPPTDSVWNAAKTNGFTKQIFQRSKSRKEKMVDTQLTVDIMKDVYTDLDPNSDCLVIVAGDADYVPAIRAARDKGFEVKGAFWDHAAAKEFKKSVSKFISLNPHFHDLSYSRHH